MRKLIFGFAMVVAVAACKKEKVQTTPSQNGPAMTAPAEQKQTPVETEKISIEHGVLSFESIEFYESIVNFEDYSKVAFTVNYLNSLAFDSFGKANPDNKSFDDAFMDAVLNADQVVKIGDWLIRINSTTKKVYAAPARAENAYELIVRETKDPSVRTFATTDNVLEALSGAGGQIQTKSLCGEDGVGEREVYSYYGTAGPNNASNRCYLRHKKFGIYFKIQTECTSPLIANQYYWITYEKKQYKKTCDDPVYMSLGTVWSPLTGPAWNDVLAQGTKNFNKYWVRISAAGRCTYNIYTGVNSYDANINYPLDIRANW